MTANSDEAGVGALARSVQRGDDVLLGNVVSVMDVLKQNGAQGLALLNRVKGP